MRKKKLDNRNVSKNNLTNDTFDDDGDKYEKKLHDDDDGDIQLNQ